MLNRLEDFRRRRRRKGELLPNPDPDVQSNSSSTSGVHSDLDPSDQQNNIYQQIWTCKTEPNPEPVYEEAPSEHIYEYIRLEPPRDDSEWEVVDDFAFSKQLRPPPPVPNRNIRHPADHYRSVCILHHPSNPRINRIFYNYRRDYIFDYRRGGDADDTSSETSSFCSSCAESSCASSSDDDDEGLDEGLLEKPDAAATTVSYSIPDCVQYWKFMLLNVNYNDDEEDVIMTEKTIAVIADNVDSKTVLPAAVPPDLPPSVDSGKPPASTPPIPIASQLHSPKFFGPAVIRSPSKSQIPASDSPVGTYTFKSNENLVTAAAPQLDKEKSPTPKRERLRDKMKAVLPLSSSWSSGGGSGNQDDGLVFGVELDQVERDEKLQVPRFVTEVVEILKEPEFIETSGLYRASGNKNSIEGIKKKLNEKRSPKKYEFLKKQDVHSLTGSLKLFFRELKSPLIPRDVYEMCVQKTKDEAQTIENIKYSLEKMELINRNTLRYLIRHLRCVHQNSDVNMMNSSNLAIVWGACLFASTLGLMESYENNDLGRINTLVRQLIDHYDKIFYSERRID
uniref:Putative rho gtpase-activating protein n=1 Tax=Culex tarsalis TaxID=7177 RepID=A0A1Q3FBH3_CULTA